MPALKPKLSSPLREHPQQVNGFYVHSSPPKVLQVHSSLIRQWLRTGDVNQLEKLVLEGQGHKLVGEYSPDPKVRSLLKQIPAYLIRTKKIQEAINRGDLKQLQKLLYGGRSPESLLSKVHMSKSQGGLSLLHKAVYLGHPHVVEFLVLNFPQTVKMKDNEGKTPLHYCGASKEAGRIWPILTKAGADVTVADLKGRQPIYYMERSNEIQLPEEKILSGVSVGSGADKTSVAIKPSNIRIWIHDRDLRKLQQVIWEGHGAKLRVETSKHPKVKRFLEGVPYILNVIKDAHGAVVGDDFEEFVKKTSSPVPGEVLGSKDANGLTPLHKAAGLNRRKIAENILQRSPNLVAAVDQEGKTPLHYAAALRDDRGMYNLLMENYADATAVDKNGKTPAYYKSNPKEVSLRLLELVPEAPRTSVTLPQTFDWSLFNSDGTTPSGGSSQPNKTSPAIIVEDEGHRNGIEPASESSHGKEPENSEGKQSPSEDKSSIAESEMTDQVEEQTNHATKEPEEGKDFDIWTNDDNDNNDDDGEGEENYEEEDNGDGESVEVGDVRDGESVEGGDVRDEENGVGEQDGEDGEEKEERGKEEEEREEEEDDPTAQESEPVADYKAVEEELRQKTEREIAEERQRLLDEGLLKVGEDEPEDEDENLKETIKAGNMEKLASMVLNGEGDKLLGKASNNPEVQSFLDNVPTYLAKITAVHAAARSGSLKDLQSALDRRKFAVAKDSADKLGATPLHVAIVAENSPIVKYLAGRFPETLASKDASGRTPLHYAAALRDDGRMYEALVNLGADPNAKDDDGHTPTYYQNNPGRLTQEQLQKQLNVSRNAPTEPAGDLGVSSPVTDPSIHDEEPEISFDEGIPLSKSAGNDDAEEDGDVQSNFNITDRDEYGQSVLHFAAARAHGRGGLFQLIHESGVNLGCRDELYRTARDVAQQANIPENVNEIDKYVISLAARGETTKLVELFLEGYDHILDLEDDEDNDIVTIVTNKNHEKTLAFLKAIPALEEKREKVHRAVRAGDCRLVEDMITESKNGRFLITGKNTSGRCSLHVAVLCQAKDITELISQKFPETLKVGDNLERTALHYAMGVEQVETLSKILIKCGAKRVTKDLKGRQPTYYFMNKTEILKLQEEENALKV